MGRVLRADYCGGRLGGVSGGVMVGEFGGGKGGGGLMCGGAGGREGEGEGCLWDDASVGHDNGPQYTVPLMNAVCTGETKELK